MSRSDPGTSPGTISLLDRAKGARRMGLADCGQHGDSNHLHLVGRSVAFQTISVADVGIAELALLPALERFLAVVVEEPPGDQRRSHGAVGLHSNQRDVEDAVNRIGARAHAGPCCYVNVVVQDVVDPSFVQAVVADPPEMTAASKFQPNRPCTLTRWFNWPA